MMSGSKHHLCVYLGTHHVATISHIEEQLSWTYNDDWLNSGFALSPHLPLTERIPNVNVQRFLRNLFPEGQGLDELLQRFNLSKSNLSSN